MSQPLFALQAFYLKKSVFELHSTWPTNAKSEEHRIALAVDVNSNTLTNDQYEVSLKLTLNTHWQEQLISKCQVVFAGNFKIQGFADEQMPLLLNAQCPALLYPYVQERIANAYLHSQVPPVHLPLLNFEAIYQEKLKRLKVPANNKPANPIEEIENA
jgi:preprotein translocase subunit SecB